MTTYVVEWWNGWTNRLRVDRFKLEERPADWRPLIKDKHNMLSVLDIHVLAVKEK